MTLDGAVAGLHAQGGGRLGAGSGNPAQWVATRGDCPYLEL